MRVAKAKNAAVSLVSLACSGRSMRARMKIFWGRRCTVRTQTQTASWTAQSLPQRSSGPCMTCSIPCAQLMQSRTDLTVLVRLVVGVLYEMRGSRFEVNTLAIAVDWGSQTPLGKCPVRRLGLGPCFELSRAWCWLPHPAHACACACACASAA